MSKKLPIRLPTEACLLKDRQRIVKSSKQRLFDKAVGGVLRQGGPSVSVHGSCKYRNWGLKCAAGHLLSDETVGVIGEGGKFYSGCAEPKVVASRLGIGDTKKTVMIQKLQNAHDEAARDAKSEDFLKEFRIRAADVALEYGLNTKVLETKAASWTSKAVANV